ncbi:hypothetical protein AUQ37_05235 [Candidatus Methanomethylophilus sp. 1R26]|uniref:hypothetical protein n=1 Tax=Candidatus Methanomethylophilus sp. 1R26 TaxID=1769296 RepID=UPI00073718B8|nr:hypothetical protein [Candidatus Methanomethylophilus sp. 1R26]KUE74293.1 hypothetical protein AUQ37_05235 [Candidatus Methanomethylophilus sp. 1R26]
MLAGPREVLKGKTLAVVSLSRGVSWITETAEAVGMRIVFGCIITRGDYRDGSEEDIPAGFSEYPALRTAEAVSEISRLAPDIVAAPSAMDLDPSVYQARTPCAPAADPFAGRWLAEDWARGMLAPRREGWRDDA